MSDHSIYSTGCYSISPSFAWWYNNPVRLAKLKARIEAKRNVEENKQKEKDRFEKIAEGTISVYA